MDTSTGVRVDPEPLCRLAREAGVLSVFDGVCATAGERFEMAAWGADLYFTGSQKAIGLPPGLALMVAGERALAARESRKAAAPPLYLDWGSWLPIHRAYEERKPSYFATPATSLVMALETGLGEILEAGIEARIETQARAAAALRAAWAALGLRSVPGPALTGEHPERPPLPRGDRRHPVAADRRPGGHRRGRPPPGGEGQLLPRRPHGLHRDPAGLPPAHRRGDRRSPAGGRGGGGRRGGGGGPGGWVGGSGLKPPPSGTPVACDLIP